MMDLFDDPIHAPSGQESLGAGATLLHGFALPVAQTLIGDTRRVIAASPFRHMFTPGGLRMAVALTNCGTAGWISDRRGYRYDPLDPLSNAPWPAMPDSFQALAAKAAAAAGYNGFRPDACLINRYEPGTRLTLHQDKNERDFSAPIVSVSLGIPAVFLFGGAQRSDKQQRVRLIHGDVMVWGGPTRLHYHGVMPLKEGHHAVLGAQRLNLTFRKAT